MSALATAATRHCQNDCTPDQRLVAACWPTLEERTSTWHACLSLGLQARKLPVQRRTPSRCEEWPQCRAFTQSTSNFRTSRWKECKGCQVARMQHMIPVQPSKTERSLLQRSMLRLANEVSFIENSRLQGKKQQVGIAILQPFLFSPWGSRNCPAVGSSSTSCSVRSSSICSKTSFYRLDIWVLVKGLKVP